MSTKRPARSRKQIDYSKFGEDSDDDFAESTPPPSKKSKVSVKDTKEKKTEKKTKAESVNLTEGRRKTERVSLEEKIFERQIQAAIELSQNKTDEVDEKTSNNAVLVEDTDEIEILQENVPPKNTECTGTTAVDDDNQKRTCRGKTPQKSKYVDDDDSESDYHEESDLEDASDASDGEFDPNDSDADFNPSTSKKKANKTPKSTKTPKCASKSTTQAKNDTVSVLVNKKIEKPPSKTTKTAVSKGAIKSPAVNQRPVSQPRSSIKSPGCSAVRRASWVPPGPSGAPSKSPLGGVSGKSPGGGIRLGLSRNIKVKPLHASVKIK